MSESRVVALTDLEPTPCVAAIGSFDGVHRGHQHLIARAVELARTEDSGVLAITFEPLPPMVLRPDRFSGRLCTSEEKMTALLAAGADRVVVVPFTRETAALSPEAFLAPVVAASGMRVLVVGEDFALGRNRVGDVPRLREIGAELGFALEAVERVPVGDEPVSSTLIRQAVMTGQAARARRLLGRPFRVAGEVIHGKKLGREIGFPTANVAPPPDLAPLADGIYAAWAWLDGDAAPRPAVTYVGARPTVNSGPRLVETHLLDFDGDLYGQTLRSDVLERLRPDETFPSLEAMIAQMQTDEARARAVLARETATAGR
ncbi:MAG: bifunctional riboflavin kinase/FAD synthetase [Thermomicrobiales bacterium]|nr:bifunctional riboflavin kinase/FAD synthetase [Thermomicrobiales bacterium]